jgi:hypothetical protein
MKRIPVLTLVVAAAALAVSVTALVSAGNSPERYELAYSEAGGSFGGFSLGNASRGEEPPGSIEAGSIEAKITGLGEDGKKVGEINTVCMVVTTDGDGQCSGTATLPDGELVLNITGPVRGDLTGSIVGGTADYEGAYGTFERVGLQTDPSYNFEFTVP